MRFYKMQGCGNDYVVLDGRKGNQGGTYRAELSKKLCDRHFGVGADGVLFVQKGTQAEFEMEMYNPDGSRGEMCGNGMRCVGKYLLERGWTEKRCFTVESMGAVKEVRLLGDAELPAGMSGGGTVFKVDMGEPGPMRSERILLHDGREKLLHCISMGNPHAVLFLEEGEDWEVESLGPVIERADCFPNRTNVEFVRMVGRNHIALRVWERGAGETLACGTGACAAAAVCLQKGLTDEEITVTLLGGRLLVSCDRALGHIFLTGPAETVFEGHLFTDASESIEIRRGEKPWQN